MTRSCNCATAAMPLPLNELLVLYTAVFVLLWHSRLVGGPPLDVLCSRSVASHARRALDGSAHVPYY